MISSKNIYVLRGQYFRLIALSPKPDPSGELQAYWCQVDKFGPFFFDTNNKFWMNYHDFKDISVVRAEKWEAERLQLTKEKEERARKMATGTSGVVENSVVDIVNRLCMVSRI